MSFSLQPLSIVPTVLLSTAMYACAPQDVIATQLNLDLPAGLFARIDGGVPTPLPATLEVPPGQHAILLSTVCGEFSATVNVPERQSTSVTAEAFEGFGVASLHVRARDPQGKVLSPTLTLRRIVYGEPDTFEPWIVPPAADTGIVLVPACRLRLFVDPGTDDLGGFMEDLDLEHGERVARALALAPGPDMVRIHGGTFRASVAPPVRNDRGREIDGMKYEKVTLETFDIDRTEVTTEQFHRCRDAGACPILNPDRPVATAVTEFSDLVKRTTCTIEFIDKGMWDYDSKVFPGREKDAVNCLAHWEAERYCKWVGKRLPSAAEWEFAAKSRHDDNAWPWGNVAPGCDRFYPTSYDCYAPGKSPAPKASAACQFPKGNTEQGLCDMVANVTEYIQVSGKPPHGAPQQTNRGAGFIADPDENELLATTYQIGLRRVDTVGGFRCARSATRKGEQ